MMHERVRRLASVSTIRWKRSVRSITWAAAEPHLGAVLTGDDAEAVVLDFVTHRPPEGSVSALVGRHGSMKPAGIVRMCDMLVHRATGGTMRVASRLFNIWPRLPLRLLELTARVGVREPRPLRGTGVGARDQ
jgi:hypothetical protein